MRTIRSRDRSKDTFTVAVWRYNAGSPLPLDSDPNTTPPPANQILTLGHKRGMIIPFGLGSVRYFGIGGTTNLTFQPWFFDSKRGLWIKFGPVSSSTQDNFVVGPPQSGGPNVAATLCQAMIGAKWWPQITVNDAVTGIQRFGYDYV